MLLFRNDMDTNKRLMYHSLVFPLFFLFCFWFVFLIEKIFGYDFHTFGIYPLTIKGLIGILTMPLIHVDVIHILVNSISFFLLSVLLFSNYRKIALPVFTLIWIISGILLWFIGRPNWHIGASAVIYGMAFFLFFSGFFRMDKALIATSLVVAFLYGGMVWYMTPLTPDKTISWEGHLSGAISGFLLSIYYKIIEPKQDIEETEEEKDVDFDWQASEKNEKDSGDDVITNN